MVSVTYFSEILSDDLLHLLRPAKGYRNNQISTPVLSNAGVSGTNSLPAGVSAHWATNTITIVVLQPPLLP